MLYADLATATSLAEVSTRLLTAASHELGRKWSDVLLDIAKRAAQAVTLTFEQGHPTLALSPTAFTGDASAHKLTLGAVLDAINPTPKAKQRPIGIILDEFQEIHTVAGPDASWHLRGIMQQHDHVSYICAGSNRHLIEEITGKNGAFYKLLDPPLHVGPIEPDFFATWIEHRLKDQRVRSRAWGVGARCVELAGPCTRDIVQLARALFALGASSGKLAIAAVDDAFANVVASQEDTIRHLWESASVTQLGRCSAPSPAPMTDSPPRPRANALPLAPAPPGHRSRRPPRPDQTRLDRERLGQRPRPCTGCTPSTTPSRADG